MPVVGFPSLSHSSRGKVASLGETLGEDLRIGPGFAEQRPGTVAGCLPLNALEVPLEGLESVM